MNTPFDIGASALPKVALPQLGPLRLLPFGIVVTFLGVLVLPALVWMSLNVSSRAMAVFWDSISSREAVFSLQFTVVLALATTVINGALGTVVALLLVRHDFPLRGFIDSVLDLPVAIPASVTGFTLLLLYGPLGMIGRVFEGEGTKIMVAFSGLLIAHVFMTLPFVVREVGPPIQLVDRSQEEAARTLGANDAQIFGTVIFPAIRGGLVAGCLFTFARSLGEFGATIIVTGNLALRHRLRLSTYSRSSTRATSRPRTLCPSSW